MDLILWRVTNKIENFTSLTTNISCFILIDVVLCEFEKIVTTTPVTKQKSEGFGSMASEYKTTQSS
jgi:hypothetical protein